MYFIAVFYCCVWLLSFQPVIVSFNFPVIRPICYIGNLVSGLSMFYFVKRLSAFRIVAQPFAD